MSEFKPWTLKDLATVKRNGLTVMSTFSCGGGSSMGYKLAGYDVIAANDIDPTMQYHYVQNLSPKLYYLCPIRDLLRMSLPNELFNLDVLDGSPPCSTFSTAGDREKNWGKAKKFREGQSKQVLSDLFFDYLDLVEKLKPRISIAENVKGMIVGKARGYVKLIMNRYREIGYTPQLFLINSADCGVPQARERVFFCAYRNDLDLPPLVLNPSLAWVSCSEACQDLELTDQEIRETRPTNSDRRWWPLTKPGETYDKAVIRSEMACKLFSHVKLHPDRPSSTLTASSDTFKHWNVCRRLTYREWKRLGSFPDDYKAQSNAIGKYMIGMSVPPLMMKYIADQVFNQWLNR